jgi:diguanylate cyclase (GGDEF)-like protein/PAS domain S-box-containing protein
MVGAVMLVVTVVAAGMWRQKVQDDERHAFAAESVQVERALAADLADIDAVLAAVGDEVVQTPDLTVEQFSGPVLRSAPADPPEAVASLTVVRPSTTVGLKSLVEQMREAGVSEFQVANPAAGEGHMVATFEQSGGALPVFDGLDLAPLPAARVTLEQARDTARAATSGVVGQLPTSDESLLRSGFLVASPGYAGGTVPAEGADREVQLELWAVALVDGEALLAAALDGTSGNLDVELRRSGALVATTAREGDAAVSLASVPEEARLTSTFDRGDPFEVVVAELGGLGDGRATSEPTLILLAGGLASVLLAALVWALARTRAAALDLADEATQTLVQSEEQFRTVVQNLSDIVLLIDEQGGVRYVSPSVRALLGWDPDEVVGRPVFAGIHEDDAGRIRAAMAGSGTSELFEFRVRHADGGYREFEGTVSGVVHEPEVGGFVFTAHDVSHRVATEERLAHDATHDPLTHLPNRSLLHDRLAHALDRSARSGAEVAVLFMDLDGFKAVNDSAGHEAGDRVLAEVAGRVAATARASDTVARFGGDEFVVVCEEAGSVEGALTLAGRIHHSLERPIEVDGVVHQVGASIGVAVARPGQRDAAGLLRRADAAMYRAKQAGRGGMEIDLGATPAGGRSGAGGGA